MTQPFPGVHFCLAVACALLVAAPARAQQKEQGPALVEYVDLQSGFRVAHPRGWRREVPAEGPVKLVLGEPRRDSSYAFTLCSIEHLIPAKPLPLPQARVDRELVNGFKNREWPQQLAGKRNVLDYQVRQVGAVPMGAVDWDSSETRNGRQDFARGIKLFRMTPASLWTVECAAVGLTKLATEGHFERNLALIAEILDSVSFPPDRR
jgi:hypothetical protein